MRRNVPKNKIIYCSGCDKKVKARLTDGKEIYPHRQDLYHLPFWKCDWCKNYVGCHHKTKDRTNPLGIIPTKMLRGVRKSIHFYIDPVWREKKLTRSQVYKLLSTYLGREYHTADLRSVKEANLILLYAKFLNKQYIGNEIQSETKEDGN